MPAIPPVETYVHEKLAQAKKTRKAATEFAHAMRLLVSAPTVRTPAGPPRPTEAATAAVLGAAPTADAPAVTLVESMPRTPVRPRKLSIGTGQVF